METEVAPTPETETAEAPIELNAEAAQIAAHASQGIKRNSNPAPEHPEDIEISNDRIAEIKAKLSLLKDAEWIADLRLLAHELGEDVEEAGENLTLVGITKPTKGSKEQKPKVFKAPQGHAAYGFEILLSQNELRATFEGQTLLLLNYLPKDNEFVVLFLDESKVELMTQWMKDLSDFIKAAKGSKTKRQAEWQARFNK